MPKKLLVSLVIILGLSGFGFYLLKNRKNIHVVNGYENQPEIYRSAQLKVKDLEKLLKSKGIDMVLNLRGESAEEWYLQEKALLEELGVEYYSYGFSVYRNTSTGGNGVLLFYSDANSTGGNVGYYLANGGLANYQSNNVNLSDERLKKDIVDCPSTWDKIKSLKVRNFKYTEDKEERVVTGLIAQETETVDANLVNSVNGLYGYEEEQKDGKFKQIYTTDLYHQMLKALQESQTRIETLETEMTALKARVTTLEE